MPSRSKTKGNAYEREIVAAAMAAGLDAKRAWGSDGRSMGLGKAVDVVINNITIQAKRRKKLPDWLDMEGVDAVVFREDRGESYAMVRLEVLLDAIKIISTRQE